MEFPLPLEQVQALEPRVARCKADDLSWLYIENWLTPNAQLVIMERFLGPHELPTVDALVKANFLSRWPAIHYLPPFLRASGISMEEGEQIVWEMASKFMPFMKGSDPSEHWDELNRTQKEIIFEWLEWSLRPVKTSFIHFAEIYPGMQDEGDDDHYVPATFEDLYRAELEIDRYRAWLAIWNEKLDEEALQDAKKVAGSS